MLMCRPVVSSQVEIKVDADTPRFGGPPLCTFPGDMCSANDDEGQEIHYGYPQDRDQASVWGGFWGPMDDESDEEEFTQFGRRAHLAVPTEQWREQLEHQNRECVAARVRDCGEVGGLLCPPKDDSESAVVHIGRK